jgi:hypothetical protein
MGMKNNTIVDRKILKERNKIVDNVANDLYEAQNYFPEEAFKILQQCGWSIMGEGCQGKAVKLNPNYKYFIILNINGIEDFNVLVECMLHELAHIKLLHDFSRKKTATVIAKQEKEAVEQTTKWFNLYYFNRNNPIKS